MTEIKRADLSRWSQSAAWRTLLVRFREHTAWALAAFFAIAVAASAVSARPALRCYLDHMEALIHRTFARASDLYWG